MSNNILAQHLGGGAFLPPSGPKWCEEITSLKLDNVSCMALTVDFSAPTARITRPGGLWRWNLWWDSSLEMGNGGGVPLLASTGDFDGSLQLYNCQLPPPPMSNNPEQFLVLARALGRKNLHPKSAKNCRKCHFSHLGGGKSKLPKVLVQSAGRGNLTFWGGGVGTWASTNFF